MKKVQQTLAASWKRRRDSDHAQTKRLLQERGVGLLGVPNELLDIIVEYSDLSTRFAAVQTSHQFSDAVARLSPRLEYRILRNRFPLLATVMDADRSHAPAAPRELFRTYSRFFGEDAVDFAPRPEPTDALDTYTLAVEVEVFAVEVEVFNTATHETESFFVGTGLVDASHTDKTVYEISVPPGIFAVVDDRCEQEGWHHLNVRIKIVAARRVGARLQHAKLYCGVVDDGEIDFLSFEYGDLPNTGSTALRWYGGVSEVVPGLIVSWDRELNPQDPVQTRRANAPSTIQARFSWYNPGDIVDQPLTDACLTLEHLVDWK